MGAQFYQAVVGVICRYLLAGEREQIASEFVPEEEAGRMIIPANVNYSAPKPMCISLESKCKISSNMPNSSVTSNVGEELNKPRTSVH